MRQVPHYLIIGNGRVSRHFQHYFSFLNINFSVWQRELPLQMLDDFLKSSTHILILISDDAIEPFILKYLKNSHAICIHFSGSLVTPFAYGAHPLMTFGSTLYNKEEYLKIHFVCDLDAPDFTVMLPGIPNKFSRLLNELKEKYHALCVLGGNFSCMLWQKLLTCFENEFNIPQTAVHPFLKQQTYNLIDNYKSALTGPLIRNDQKTITKNLSALDNDPFQAVYQSFIKCYEYINEEKL